MRWNYVGCILVLLAVCSGAKTEEKDTLEDYSNIYNLVCVDETAQAFTNPQGDSTEVIRPFRYWQMARWIETAPNGMEQVQLDNCDQWWVKASAFYPLYKVTSAGADLLVVYDVDGEDNPHKKPNGVRVAAHLEPGTKLGVCMMAQALQGTYLVATEDKQYGYVECNKLMPMGNLGPY
jgi:hypothetical protein